jgi:L-cysteine:1D-myo-inositol 2-amino-2-deoxy-alpha-D-glucopyranoside ligase
MYVCGITPYDATHLGHAATYVAFDLLNRALRDGGHEVHHVQNVTDVDDPLLERATTTGVDWRDLAADQTNLFGEDMCALGVLPPRAYVGAVESVPLVVEATRQLLDLGCAYRIPAGPGAGDIYFAVSGDPGFGSLSHLDETSMRTVFASRGGDPDREDKKHPLDCLLWRAERPGEPSWDGDALGPGRPGWHIECTAIALAHLGEAIDVQGGGSDLVFPHHEMSIAQAHALTGHRPFARAAVHAGMVGLDGEKMSKSLGNLVLVSQLRADGHDPAAIRLGVLAHHYRRDWEWTPTVLAAAETRLARWRAAFSQDRGPAAGGAVAAVREALADDLDAPTALVAVDTWADAQLADGGDDPGATGLLCRAVDALLGIRL